MTPKILLLGMPSVEPNETIKSKAGLQYLRKRTMGIHKGEE